MHRMMLHARTRPPAKVAVTSSDIFRPGPAWQSPQAINIPLGGFVRFTLFAVNARSFARDH